MKQILIIALVLFAVSCQNAGTKKAENITVEVEIVEVKFQVQGMHCTNCEQSVVKGVNELEGIEFVEASFADSLAIVKYDNLKTNETEISEKIEKRGYEVKGKL
ncbi:MAG: heavy-metal-associated domain-containing protein [Mariniphaga sp.]|nr:heavy-metal-associated domain-containing protein [Mariniphaga sp.]